MMDSSPEKELPHSHNVEFQIRGMTCASCVRHVEKAISKVAGVESAQVNLITERATVLLNNKIDSELIVQAVEAAGYSAHAILPAPTQIQAKQASERNSESHSLRKDFYRSLSFAVPLMFLGMAHGVELLGFGAFADSHSGRSLQMTLASLILFGPGARFFVSAWAALRRASADMNVLVAVGAGTAYAWSLVAVVFPGIFSHAQMGHSPMNHAPMVYFEAAGAIVTFLLLGKYLEANAKKRLTDAVQELVALRPETAHKLVADQIIDVASTLLAPGDRIVVRPGERIPADATIVEGESSVDESMLSGESIPVDKAVGSSLVGGSLNKQGSLVARVDRVGNESTLSRIAKAVEDAQGSKAPIAQLADRVSAVFVPVVILLALATLVGWLLFDSSNNGVAQAIEHFVSVLVIACPCALGLATPAAIAAATGRGAQLGILIRGGESLEAASKVTAVLLDKTGTLTQGKPKVTKVLCAPTRNEVEILRIVASLEERSEHPLARAIVAAAKDRSIDLLNVTGFLYQHGLGVEASLNAQRVRVGNAKWMEHGTVSLEHSTWFAESDTEGATLLFVAVDGVLSGVIAVEDPPLAGISSVLDSLKAMGIACSIASGDRTRVVKNLAKALGIAEAHGDMLPDSKSKLIKEKQSQGLIVAMVGDGVNDAPALASANVGIALGHGSEIAVSAADIALLDGGITRLPLAFQLARRAMSIIRGNLFWAFAFNTIGIPLAAGLIPGWSLSPIYASAAMSLSSVAVILNSLRLKQFGFAERRATTPIQPSKLPTPA